MSLFIALCTWHFKPMTKQMIGLRSSLGLAELGQNPMLAPPSTGRTAPVMNPAAGLQR